MTGGQTVLNEWPLIGGVAMTTAKEGDFIRPEYLVPGFYFFIFLFLYFFIFLFFNFFIFLFLFLFLLLFSLLFLTPHLQLSTTTTTTNNRRCFGVDKAIGYSSCCQPS